MADKIKTAMEWLATKQQAFQSRAVTYRGIREGVEIELPLTVGVGSSQLTPINPLAMQPGLESAVLQDPEEVDRDYIVRASDLKDAGLWPPDGGDFVDDTNDEVGVINRYQVKSVPAQSPWRWLTGSYNIQARVHTKFFQEVATYWLDAFTEANGTALTDHTPDTGSEYAGGSGTVAILANRITASTGTAFHYFAPGELNTLTSIKFRFNVLADELEGKVAEVGVGVRCGASGSGQREGVYCTVKVGYSEGEQTIRQLRMVRRRNGANTTVQVLPIPGGLTLTTVYQIRVVNIDDKVLVTLADETGAVSIAEVANESTLLNDNTGQAVFFQHTLTVPSGPWMDDLKVEATDV